MLMSSKFTSKITRELIRVIGNSIMYKISMLGMNTKKLGFEINNCFSLKLFTIQTFNNFKPISIYGGIHIIKNSRSFFFLLESVFEKPFLNWTLYLDKRSCIHPLTTPVELPVYIAHEIIESWGHRLESPTQ